MPVTHNIRVFAAHIQSTGSPEMVQFARDQPKSATGGSESQAVGSTDSTDAAVGSASQRSERRAIRRQLLRDTNPQPRKRIRSTTWWYRLSMHKPQINTIEWSRVCSFCGSRLLHSESNGWCCNKGAYIRPALPDYPETVVTQLDAHQAEYSLLSRRLNNLFSFTAIGVDGEFIPFRGPANVALTGRTYHRILHLDKGEHSLKWFLYDEDGRRLAAAKNGVPDHMVKSLRQLLEDVNPYLRVIKRSISQAPEGPLNLILDQPVAGGEIAAVIDLSNLQKFEPRKIVFFRQSNRQPTFMNILSAQYEPMQYPLLFPHGTPGWSPQNIHNLTQIQWYRFNLTFERRFLRFGRLACEYCVDMYSRVEENKLYFLRNMRGAQAQSMDDPGNMEVNIPSSFLGSRAWASQQVADSLALCREFGKPSLFITMTTNPKWIEITNQLQQGQDVADIPSIVCRVFHQKAAVLVQYLMHHFGKVLYMVRVVEFQKRGLPHLHLIMKMEPELPFANIDDIISAELPTEESDPALRKLVSSFNTHRKTHLDSPNSRCYKKGKCQYNFPHPVTLNTTIDEFGRVQYRRRKDEDAWIVSYMPSLTRLMQCHIHVDVCFTVNVFMYLYKYLFKGPDQARYSIVSGESITEPDGQVVCPWKDHYQPSGRESFQVSAY